MSAYWGKAPWGGGTPWGADIIRRARIAREYIRQIYRGQRNR